MILRTSNLQSVLRCCFRVRHLLRCCGREQHKSTRRLQLFGTSKFENGGHEVRQCCHRCELRVKSLRTIQRRYIRPAVVVVVVVTMTTRRLVRNTAYNLCVHIWVVIWRTSKRAMFSAMDGVGVLLSGVCSLVRLLIFWFWGWTWLVRMYVHLQQI